MTPHESKFYTFGVEENISLYVQDPQVKRVTNTEEEKDKVTEKTRAIYVKSVRDGDATFVIYSYVVGNKEYGFAWETLYDETHRAYSGDTHKQPYWYDKLQPGADFLVTYSKTEPWRHYVGDKDLMFYGSVFLEAR
jgi:hypothetical protein